MENYNLVRPEHLSHHGSLFGGQLLSWVDECSWMAAVKDYPHCDFVIRAMDKIEFKHNVKNGSILRFSSRKIKLGNSSVTYLVEAFENDRSTKEEQMAFSAFVTLVAVNKQGEKQRIQDTSR